MVYKKIDDVCYYMTKSTIKAGEGTKEGKYPFFTSSNKQTLWIDKCLFDGEYLIIGTGGSASCNYYNGRFSVSTDNFVVGSKSVNVKYLYYVLKANNYSLLEQGFHGAGLKHISKDYFGSIKFPCYSKEKQDEIVDVLDNLSLAIDRTEKSVELFDELIESRFYEMFGDPVENNLGWKTKKLKDIVFINKYKGPVSKDNGKVWLLNLDMVESNTGRILNYLYVDESEVGSSTIRFDNNCVLYSKLRPYLNKVVIPDRSGFATSEMLALSTTNINKYFLAYLLRSKSFVTFINNTSYGAKMPRASVDEIKQFDLISPPLSLQESFASFVLEVNRIKMHLKQKSDFYQELLDKKTDEFFGGN